jgi:hypothetical protein
MIRHALRLAALALLPSAAIAADAGATLRSKGVELCFGRVYDAGHMTRHKRQPLSAIHVFKSFTMDPLSEDKPVPREKMIAADEHVSKAWIIRRARDGKLDDVQFPCSEIKPSVFECSRGDEEFPVRRLELRASGDKVFARSGLDTKEVYRLESRPLAECLAWRDKARPDWVGKSQPLRLRFAERAPVCHAAAGTPKLALRTLRPVETEASDHVPHSMLRVTLALTLADGTTRVRHTRCDSSGYDYWCQYGHGVVHLAPAGDRAIAVFEGPHEPRASEPSPFEQFFGVTLKPEQRRFVVEERDDAVCPQD